MLNGAVLAGGRSSRMGQSKAGLRLQGVSLLERTVSLLRATLGDQATVWVSLGARDEASSGSLGSGEEEVKDLFSDRGPLGGIASVLMRESQASRQEAWILFIPVDMPALKAETLQLALEQGVRAGIAECICFQGHELPLLLKNTAALREKVRILLSPETPSAACSIKHLRSLLQSQVIALSPLQELEFCNLNTSGDWEKFLAGCR